MVFNKSMAQESWLRVESLAGSTMKHSFLSVEMTDHFLFLRCCSRQRTSLCRAAPTRDSEKINENLSLSKSSCRLMHTLRKRRRISKATPGQVSLHFGWRHVTKGLSRNCYRNFQLFLAIVGFRNANQVLCFLSTTTRGKWNSSCSLRKVPTVSGYKN